MSSNYYISARKKGSNDLWQPVMPDDLDENMKSLYRAPFPIESETKVVSYVERLKSQGYETAVTTVTERNANAIFIGSLPTKDLTSLLNDGFTSDLPPPRK